MYLSSSKRISVPMHESSDRLKNENAFPKHMVGRLVFSLFKFCNTIAALY